MVLVFAAHSGVSGWAGAGGDQWICCGFVENEGARIQNVLSKNEGWNASHYNVNRKKIVWRKCIHNLIYENLYYYYYYHENNKIPTSFNILCRRPYRWLFMFANILPVVLLSSNESYWHVQINNWQGLIGRRLLVVLHYKFNNFLISVKNPSGYNCMFRKNMFMFYVYM